jgi:hypothetical protein
MKNFYHGVLLDLQFDEENFIEKNFKIFAKRKSSSNPWVLYGVEINNENLDDGIVKIQTAMKSDAPYYAHLYNDNGVIVIFKNKGFHVKPHISTWDEIVKYGQSLNIPSEQLDFWPNRFQDEIHYFKKEDYILGTQI